MSPQEAQLLEQRLAVQANLTNARVRMSDALNDPVTAQMSVEKLMAMAMEEGDGNYENGRRLL